MPAYLVFVATCFGLVIGSFLNVVIYRLPNGQSVVHPPSHCPSCGASVRAFDNVPVLAWLWLRGKCRDCNSGISARYPAIEALTGAITLHEELSAWRERKIGKHPYVILDARYEKVRHGGIVIDNQDQRFMLAICIH